MVFVAVRLRSGIRIVKMMNTDSLTVVNSGNLLLLVEDFIYHCYSIYVVHKLNVN